MEPETNPIDLSVLDPTRDPRRFDAAVANIAQRAIELRRLRRVVVRRGAIAFAVAMAAALVLWFSAPRREPQHTSRNVDILEWATRDVQASDLLELELGGSHAQ
ncbi:MAG TPA: hypothetical protein VIV40_12675 [Kofleriaceae bacterium]